LIRTRRLLLVCFVTGDVMRNEDITLLFQGPWVQATAARIASAKMVFSGAYVVLSTWKSDSIKVETGLVDEVVFSDDPGELPPYKFGEDSPPNNINRQIVSAKAGLARVRTPYVAKLRTDCSLDSRAVVDIYLAQGADSKIVVSSFYTVHPDGIEAFQFHVSDWFQFGRTQHVRQYWDLALMSEDEALWFERRDHAVESHYFARLYRSRYAPEQHVSVAYAKKKGYRTPDSIDDRRPDIVVEYKHFLASQFVVMNHADLDLVFAKYDGLRASNYQFFNCVNVDDWLSLQAAYAPLSASSVATSLNTTTGSMNRTRAVSLMRKIDSALPWIKKAGCMPLVGKCLGFYR
jgi:hypothetical protein